MKKVDISLATIESVRQFVNIVAKYSIEIDLSSGRYVVDAKSIMGIFSLDLSKPINVEIHSLSDQQSECDNLIEQISEFAI